MGSASSKCRRVRLRASSGPSDTPRLPQELLDEIMDHLAGDSTSLRHCSTAARAFVPSCRRHLFSRVVFRPHNLPTWKATFPNPSTSPATYTREMRIHLVSDMPIQLPEYMPYFSNVRDLALIGGRCENYEWISTIGKLPASIRSLTMKFVSVTNSQVLEIMGQLPNLDNFSLCTFQRGDFPARMGGILKGRYSGRLELLLTGDSHASIVESLLEAPAGLAFKSMKAFCNAEDDFPVYAALVTSCQDTLTDLDISVSAEGDTPHEIQPTVYANDSGSRHYSREERSWVRPFPPQIPRTPVVLFALEVRQLPLVICGALNHQSSKFTAPERHNDLSLSLRSTRTPSL